MEQPEQDAEALALEEQFGIPTISLSFPDGRVVIPIDARKLTRECKAANAKLHDVVARRSRSSSV